jgi:pimeloyl-ACP methyl ester carboxylesterase
MDHYAADASAVVESLDLHNACMSVTLPAAAVARYVAKYGQPQGRVAKAVLVSAVPPLMVKTEDNPGGTPIRCLTASVVRWQPIARSFTST